MFGKRIRKLEATVADIGQRLKVVECSHEKVEFVSSPLYGHRRKCVHCGKVLQHYDKEQYLIAKLAHTRKIHKEQIDQDKADLKLVQAVKKVRPR